MEAKDTVMGKTQRDNLFYQGIGTLEGVCQMQAEISFKAGRKEVVDWLNQDSNTLEIEVGGGISRVIDRYTWQAKLKEWGIPNE